MLLFHLDGALTFVHVTPLTLTKKFRNHRSQAVLRQYLVSWFLHLRVSLTLVALTEEVN